MLKFLPNHEKIIEDFFKSRQNSKRILLERYRQRWARSEELPVNLVPLFTGQIMRRGFRVRALNIFCRLLDIIRLTGEEPFSFLFVRLNRIRPSVSFRIIKKRNRVLRLPYLLKPEAEWRMAVSRLVNAARGRRERTMTQRLYAALLDLDNQENALLSRKLEDERMAIQNLTFFRFMRKWKFSKRRVS